ncbi:helicase with zinc finger domain 2-like isoform X2 [Corticium candelabrum]|uniref:helicase with zinc finger domain 2-like isoform X2 n=1 Tax=Corticium candelabrum TaxID=121492 RepID=UPI002E257333|nr:helicase with zinc finger domain 2-like isoform X2 [Corticium candelabrum]
MEQSQGEGSGRDERDDQLTANRSDSETEMENVADQPLASSKPEDIEEAPEQSVARKHSTNSVQSLEDVDTEDKTAAIPTSPRCTKPQTVPSNTFSKFKIVKPKQKSRKKIQREEYKRKQESEKIGKELVEIWKKQEEKEEKRKIAAAAAATAFIDDTAMAQDNAAIGRDNDTKELENVQPDVRGVQFESSTAKRRRRAKQQSPIAATTEQRTTSSPQATLNITETTNRSPTKLHVANAAKGSKASSVSTKAQKMSFPSSMNEGETRTGSTTTGISRQSTRKPATIPETRQRELTRRKGVSGVAKDHHTYTNQQYQELIASQSPVKSLLEDVVRRINLYSHEAVASDTSQNPFLRFRQEVIDRGRVVCWICFIKDGGVLTERDEKIDRCPVHIKNNWNPMLVWPSGSSWASVRPRHVLSKATGLFGVCRRGPDCCGPRDCRRPHNKTEKDAWTLDRDGIIWKKDTRPPPRPYYLKECKNYQKYLRCPYKHYCRCAHGKDELEEWIQYTAKQKHEKQGQSWRQQVCDELVNRLKIDGDLASNDVITDQRQGVEIEKEEILIDLSKSQQYEEEFVINVTDEMGCCLNRAALLRRDCFTFVEPATPDLLLSDDGRVLECASVNGLSNVLIRVKFESATAGSFACDLIFDLGGWPYLVRTLRVEVVSTETVAALKQLQWHTRPKDDHWDVEENEIIYPNNLACDTRYSIPIPNAASLASDISRLGIVGDDQKQELTKYRYKPLFHTLLFLEEIICDEFLRNFSAKDVVLSTDDNKALAGIWTVTLNRPVPPKTAEMALIKLDEHIYAVPVMSVTDVSVELNVSVNPRLAKVVRDRGCFKICVDCRLKRNNTHFSQLHRSVENLRDDVIVTHLLGEVDRSFSIAVPSFEDLLDPEIGNNRRQKKAVLAILKHSSPLPLIINGAFGTGKTRLLAEAVRLLTATRDDIRVLICTMSNHAADLYVQSFDRSTHENSCRTRLMRVCYKFRNISTVPAVVRKYCDYVDDQFVTPSVEEFKNAEESLIVVTTLITSAELLDVGLEVGFFTHIVIDEAAQATEPESVTPLALAGSKTVLVLAGDRCQINPSIQSSWARSGKLQRSLFRRLYKLLPSKSIISLITNYRCNYEIFCLTLSLFYNYDDAHPDQCKAPVQDPHPDYHPFSFFAVTEGTAEQGGSDGSYVNLKEALVVVDQVMKVLYRWPMEWRERSEADVCVVASEYRQVQYIRHRLRSAGLSGVSVLTSGSIQGREFRAVVLSTVMTDREYSEEYEREPNFLSNVKMLNTAMTRAKSLVLVVGDPDCLARCKIGEKWMRYLEECRHAGPSSLMGESNAIAKIVDRTSNLNPDARDFIPFSEDALVDLPAVEIVEGPCHAQLGTDEPELGDNDNDDDDHLSTRSEDSNSWYCPSDYTSDSDSSIDSRSDEQDEEDAELPERTRRRYYDHLLPERKMLDLLESKPERYVRCILTVTSGGEIAHGVVADRSKSDILIEGRRRRNRAFDGEEVLVKTIKKKDGDAHDDVPGESNDGQNRGRVIGIFRRMRPSQFICRVDESTTHMMIPLERGHPIVWNRRSDRSHTQCGGCVVLFDYSTNKRGKICRPVERKCLPIKEATDKLFLVQFMSWSVYSRYPTGIASDCVDVGLAYQTSKRVLGFQYSIPNNEVKDVDVTSEVQQNRELIIENAFTIDSEQSEDMDDALALMKYDEKTKICEVGVFIADVSHFVSRDSSVDKQARDIGMTVYDERGRQVCPMLPRRLSNDVCSLVQDRKRRVLAVFHRYNMTTGESISPARFEKRIIKSCCKMSYEKAQMLIDGQCPDLKCSAAIRFDLLRQVSILFPLSRQLRKRRLERAMHYREVDKVKDTLAHELVEEFMISTNTAVATQLLECCPDVTPLVCQWEPKQQMIEELLTSCGNLTTTSCRLASKIRHRYCGVSSFQMLSKKNVCPRLHIAKQTLDHIEDAVSDGRGRDVVTAVCVEGFHPQLALANSKFIRSQQKAIYICSANHEESVLKHSDLDIIYTHFTSPIRRYVDLVCHRLVKQYLISPRDSPAACCYTENEMKEVCNHVTFRSVNMKRFQRELELLQFAHEIHDHPVSTVAVIEKIEGGQLSLFVPYCPNLPARNCQVRLSSLSACACDHTTVDEVPALSVSWAIDMLPVLPSGSSRGLDLTENEYVSVSTNLWKELVSEVSKSVELSEESMRYCEEIVCRIMGDTTRSESLAVARQELLSLTCTSRPSGNTDSTSVERRDRSECSEEDDDDDNDSDGFEVVLSRSARRQQRQESQQAGGERRFRSHQKRVKQSEAVTAKAELKLFGLLSVQLSSKKMRSLRRPIVQLINFSNGISVCIEHNSYPSDCFAGTVSSSALVASKRKYRHLEEYAQTWLPLVDIESASGSVRGSSTGSPSLLYDFHVSWRKQGINEVIGVATLDRNYAKEKKIAFDIGDLVCLRYFNLPFFCRPSDKYRDGATAELLKSRSFFNLVCHCRIQASELESSHVPSPNVFGKDSEKTDQLSNDNEDGKRDFEEIIIKLCPCDCDHSKKKTLLSLSKKKTCVAQMIHLALPYKRMNDVLNKRIYEVNTDVVKETICGTFNGIRSGKKLVGVAIDPVDCLSRSLKSLLKNRPCLNKGQYEALQLALKQDVTLIQGPPGTGKTITGVHIACWFADSNKKYNQLSSNKKRQVMFCAPSNEAVDQVTKNLMEVTKKEEGHKHTRILRVYGKSIEQQKLTGPWSFKRYAYVGVPLVLTKEDTNLSDVVLHRRIRDRQHNPTAQSIINMETEFKEMIENNEEPDETQVVQYRKVVSEAEESEIKAADIVLCTCMQAGNFTMRSFASVYQCIVDEAGQCTEPETLVAIARPDLKKIVLIGDHKQLQPVVVDPLVKKQLCTSLFERLASRAFMLKEQYRMHPSICEFPSQMFYGGQLLTPDEIKRRPTKGATLWSLHPQGDRCPKCFIHLDGKEELNPIAERDKGGEESKFNGREINAAINLVECMISRRHHIAQSQIRIITPYTAQRAKLESEFRKRRWKDVQVSSIAASQGGEADFVILSTVRSLPRDQIMEDPTKKWISDHLGFVTDEHQMNVALTRARHGLFILGNRYLLQINKMWRRLIQHFNNEDRLISNPDAERIKLLF